MYLTIIILPLLGLIASGFFGIPIFPVIIVCNLILVILLIAWNILNFNSIAENKRYIVLIITQLGILQLFAPLRVIVNHVPLKTTSIILCIYIIGILAIFFKQLVTTGGCSLSKSTRRLLICNSFICCFMLVFMIWGVVYLELIHIYCMQLSLFPFPVQQIANDAIYNNLNSVTTEIKYCNLELRSSISQFHRAIYNLYENETPSNLNIARFAHHRLQVAVADANANLDRKRQIYAQLGNNINPHQFAYFNRNDGECLFRIEWAVRLLESKDYRLH